ncbi:MAG: hypothetical protein ACYS4W_03150 [Planctomycetota bacterium]
MSEAKQNNTAENQKPKTSMLAKGSILSVALGAGLWGMAFVSQAVFRDCGPCLITLGWVPILLGIPLGIAAIVSILFSGGRSKGIGLSGGAIALAIGLLWSMVYAFQRGMAQTNELLCGANLYSIYHVLLLYSTDYEGNLPTAAKWCDLVCGLDIGPEGYPRNISKTSLSCGNAPGAACTYALNKNLEGIKLSQVPEDIVLLFEAKPGWNQVGGPEILNTDNHEGKGCNVLFNDGSIKFVQAEEVGELKWKVEEADSIE